VFVYGSCDKYTTIDSRLQYDILRISSREREHQIIEDLKPKDREDDRMIA
jgi:hypothetical protein